MLGPTDAAGGYDDDDDDGGVAAVGRHSSRSLECHWWLYPFVTSYPWWLQRHHLTVAPLFGFVVGLSMGQ